MTSVRRRMVSAMQPARSLGSPPRVVVTFLIELPVDLRLDEGLTLYAYERTADVEVPVFNDPHSTSGDLAIDARFVFRCSPPQLSPMRTIALDVFDDFWEGLNFVQSEPARDEARRRAPATVVAATAATIASRASGEVAERDLARIFDKTLHQLNEFLTMLGFTRSNPAIGSVRRTELPAYVPVVLDLVDHAPRRQAELATLQVHTFDEPSAPPVDAVLDAHDLAFRDRLSEWPFRSVVALVHRAHRDQHAGDCDQCVLALVTATELLAEAVIRAALQATGEEHRIDGVLRAGFMNLVRDHLAPLIDRLGGDRELAARWLGECYELRKRVAHEGHVPGRDEAAGAFRATTDLVGEIGDVLRRSEHLSGLGSELLFSRTR